MKKIILAILLIASSSAFAEFNIIVPFAAAGSIDMVARQFQKWVVMNTKEPVVVENVGGAGGYIGIKKLEASPPNTASITSGSFYVNSIEKDFPLDKFKYAAVLGESPYFLVVKKTSGITCNTLRNNSRTYFFGSGGKNSLTSISAQALIKKYKHITEIPYKGGGQVMIDLLSGQLDATFVSNLDRNDDLLYLAVTSEKRMHDIPTLKECLGVTQRILGEYILLVNHTSSTEFVQKLNSLAISFAKDPNTIKWAEQQGITLRSFTVEGTNKHVNERYLEWKNIIEKE